MSEPWKGEIISCRILDHVYFIGGYPASIHVVETGDGLIVLDTGYAENREAYLGCFPALGLSLRDVRWIFLTHGHIDHIGNAAFLKARSGARIAIGAPDRRYVNGQADLTYAGEFGMTFGEPFEPDLVLNDGDAVTVGGAGQAALSGVKM